MYYNHSTPVIKYNTIHAKQKYVYTTETESAELPKIQVSPMKLSSLYFEEPEEDLLDKGEKLVKEAKDGGSDAMQSLGNFCSELTQFYMDNLRIKNLQLYDVVNQGTMTEKLIAEETIKYFEMVNNKEERQHVCYKDLLNYTFLIGYLNTCSSSAPIIKSDKMNEMSDDFLKG